MIDISLSVGKQTPIWPGSIGSTFKALQSIGEGSESNVTGWNTDLHVGTHVDAPKHFLREGATLDSFPLETFYGPTYVVEISEADALDANTLAQANIPQSAVKVLFKTKNSLFWKAGEKTFQQSYVGLAPDGARWVVERGIQLVGIDYLSIARFQDIRETHEILLSKKIAILEGLDLHAVSAGWYTLCCFPIKLENTEAAPVRAVLLPDHFRSKYR